MEFDNKTAQLEQKWNSIAPGFHPWFMQHKADTFRTSMIASVREAAQPGSPPQMYTDNANESKNFVLKDWVDFSKNTIPAFIAELRSFVQQSVTEADRAVYGAGEYYLSEEFKHLEVRVKIGFSSFYNPFFARHTFNFHLITMYLKVAR